MKVPMHAMLDEQLLAKLRTLRDTKYAVRSYQLRQGFNQKRFQSSKKKQEKRP